MYFKNPKRKLKYFEVLIIKFNNRNEHLNRCIFLMIKYFDLIININLLLLKDCKLQIICLDDLIILQSETYLGESKKCTSFKINDTEK